MAETERKIQRARTEAESNERDLEKKKEELRTVEQNIKILESGGQVEDQGVTLQKNLDSTKLDLQTTQAKQRSIENEIRRN